MDYKAMFARALRSVASAAYRVDLSDVDPRHLPAVREVTATMREGFEPDVTRRAIAKAFEEGRIDRVTQLSLLSVVAAHPTVAQWGEALRLAAEEELEAWRVGGARLDPNLAAVARHRGTVFLLAGHPEAAAGYFCQAAELCPTPQNLANLLIPALRLEGEDTGRSLLEKIRRTSPAPVVAGVDAIIARDPDLALLRS
jgi:hypothetical protein